MSTLWRKTRFTKAAAKRIAEAPGVWLTPEGLADGEGVPVVNENKPEPKQSLREAYDSWAQAGHDRKAAQPLLKALKPTVDAALKSYAGNDDAMRTKANIMALNAAKGYNPKEGTQLNTFVMSHLRGLNRLYGTRSQMVKVPERSRMDWINLEKASKNLEIENNREPTLDELADATNLSIRKIEKLRAMNRGEASEGQWTSQETGVSTFMKDNDPQRIWAEYVYHELDPIDKKIYEWSTGYGGAKRIDKKMDMAKRLKISAPAVSARINKIIAKLQEAENV
jgi:DNA-directed RNA polymerase specialized sigma subunit